MKVKLVEITEDSEKTMAYIARVSNPSNQENEKISGLLSYCIKHGHWSVFEHSHMTLEIETSLAIATQILRHNSMRFQQFSQRYSDPTDMGFEPIEWRVQAEKNRQSSLDLTDAETYHELQDSWEDILKQIQEFYKLALKKGIAREAARFVLPQCTRTRLYMTGNIRNWIHYIQLRIKEDVQLEHRQVALAAKKIFISQLPVVSQALGWTENTKEK